MATIEEYGVFETAWCPGCGDHAISKAVKAALAGLGLSPHQVLVVSGIGQAAKSPQYMNCNMFNGLHGRSLPPAQGAKMANPGLPVLVESGDGCSYGEGGNHFLAAIRRNLDITVLVHDNQIYGLTKGQASPTTAQGHKTKAQPLGQASEPFSPLAVAVALRAPFVARGYCGEQDHLVDLIQRAVRHPGFALVDILQPCVSFNKVNTYAWYKERVYKLDASHDPTDPAQALAKAQEFGPRIPIGVISTCERPTFESRMEALSGGPLALRKVDMGAVRGVMESFRA
jgi:2-oxoglutarate ferredoxin oxidoreductase subunit beta